MAVRKIEEIYNEIKTEKETHTSLDTLLPNPENFSTFLEDASSTSKVASWRFLIYLMAYAINILEQMFDSFKNEIIDLSESKETGTARWYQQEALKFQFGVGLLTWNGKKFVYDVIDTSVRIVAQAAVVESGGIVTIKVAKESGGLYIPLTSGASSEMEAFNDYIDAIKFAGVWVNTISQAHDEMKLYLKIYYDPQVLASDGSLLSAGSTFPVEDTVNDYLRNIPFNSTFNVTELIDLLQATNGVKNPFFTSAEAKPTGGTYTAVTETYVAEAGHMRIDTGFALSTTITYVAG